MENLNFDYRELTLIEHAFFSYLKDHCDEDIKDARKVLCKVMIALNYMDSSKESVRPFDQEE